MVIHDEESLEEALSLIGSGSIRYSDTYAYIIVTNLNALEKLLRSALGRGDIAIVVPLGMESTMEVHTIELKKVKVRRQREERIAIREYFREHPESVANVEKYAKKRGDLQ